MKNITLKSIKIDLSAVGLTLSSDNYPYYCTPKNAKIFGWAGVDGIHYCTVPRLGKTVFAVNPSNFGNCVHPIARNDEDLLRLLLACRDMAALEQCHAWSKERFSEFLRDCPETQEQREVLNQIRAKTGLTPMNDAFEYIKSLQAEFDYSKIPYTDDYYDNGMNPAAAPKESEWAVRFNGNFFEKSGEGRPGKEIKINKSFVWENQTWYVPSVYECGKGLVADFCVKADSEALKNFSVRLASGCSDVEESENPLCVDFTPYIKVNGKNLNRSCGSCEYHIPQELVSAELEENSPYAKRVVVRYGLDEKCAWVIRRQSFLWATAKKPKINSAKLKLERAPARKEGIRLKNPKKGDSFEFVHPFFGTRHTLTVCEYENCVVDSASEFYIPNRFTKMVYTVNPPISANNFSVDDCRQSDSPEPQYSEEMSAIGIIGGADGPTAVFFGNADEKSQKRSVAYSALTYQPQAEIEWKLVFTEKTFEDIETVLLP